MQELQLNTRDWRRRNSSCLPSDVGLYCLLFVYKAFTIFNRLENLKDLNRSEMRSLMMMHTFSVVRERPMDRTCLSSCQGAIPVQCKFVSWRNCQFFINVFGIVSALTELPKQGPEFGVLFGLEAAGR